jgi:hypothetical protein
MRIAPVVLAAALFTAGCGAQVPSPTVPPSPSPTPTALLLPLPAHVAGIPGPGDATALLAPQSRPGELEAGVARNFTLGHCGLISPIDFDGSLWDPIAGHDGSGGPLTDDQMGDLINATTTVVELIDPNTTVLRTPLGAVITLRRHDGARPYFLCD